MTLLVHSLSNEKQVDKWALSYGCLGQVSVAYYKCFLNRKKHTHNKTKVSYRKQVARKLRTQYVDGIYDNPWPWNLG